MKNPLQERDNYLEYEELIKRNKQLNELTSKGIVIIPKKKLKTLGWIFIGLGFLSSPIPLTTLPLIAVGLTLLGLSKQELVYNFDKRIKRMLYKLRYKKE